MKTKPLDYPFETHTHNLYVSYIYYIFQDKSSGSALNFYFNSKIIEIAVWTASKTGVAQKKNLRNPRS